MKFQSILDFKNKLKYRENNPINFMKIRNINRLENSLLISGEVISSDGNNIWHPKIKFNNSNIISSDSNILVECDCYSFLYEFSRELYNNKSLLYPEKYKKNIHGHKQLKILSACKHVITLSKEIMRNSHKINSTKVGG